MFRKRKKSIKCGKRGHYAKYCRSTRKINHIADEKSYSAYEDGCTAEYPLFRKKTLILKTKFKNLTKIQTVTEEYRDVNDNKIQFKAKTTGSIEVNGTKNYSTDVSQIL